MAAIANVKLTDTFDDWRTKTNQLINVYDETNLLARSSYNATNLAARTAANLAANVISGNTGVYTTIYNNANTITNDIITIKLTNFYDAANASYDKSNVAIVSSNLAYDQSNVARDTANTAVANVIAYSDSTNTTISLFTVGQTSNYANFTSTTNNTLTLYFNAMNVTSNITRTIANNAYDTANTFVANSSNIIAGVLASNTAFQETVNAVSQIIATSVIANTDFGRAYGTANLGFDKANTANIVGSTAFNAANAAFTQANTANATAIAAFNQANTANPTSIAAFNTANAAFTLANTTNATSIAAFTLANTTNATSIAAFNQANTANPTSIAAFNAANAAFGQANTANPASAAAFNTANASFNATNSAFTLANTGNATAIAAFVRANTVNNIAVAAFTQANTATLAASASFNKANSAAQLSFVTVNANGSSLVAGSASDTLTLAASSNVSISGNPAIDTATFDLTNSGVTAGTYGTTTAIPAITVDAKGRITSASELSPAFLSTSGGTLTGDLTIYRNATPTTGVVFLGNSGARYLFFDGTNYVMPGSSLFSNGSLVLTASNYNSYAPTLTGTGASGNWSINITGSATTFTSTTQSSQFNSIGVGTAPSGTAGEIRATNEVTAYYSDARLKTDIEKISNASDKLKLISGILYKNNELAKSFGFTKEERQVGVLAQEIQKVLPEAVRNAPFDIAENGTSKSGEDYLTVKYELLVPLLIEALKDALERIEKLESK